MKFRLVENAKGQWWFEPVSKNGKEIGNQWYEREGGARKGIAALRKGAATAEIIRVPWKGKKAERRAR